MFTSQPIGFVNSPHTNTGEIPKGLGAKHEADGVLTILPDFEKGLMDIEGFSHLFIIWEFDSFSQVDSRLRLPTIGRKVSLRPDLRCVRTRSA